MRTLFALSVLVALAACSVKKDESRAGPPPGVPQPQALIAPVPLSAQKMSLLAKANIVLPDRALLVADVVDTPEARETGLMFREKLAPDYGMLFVFPKAERLEFWMKNTYVDLDMVWLDAARRVAVVHRDVPRSAKDTPEEKIARRGGEGLYVLELPAGAAMRHKIKVGDVLDFKVPAAVR
ncbi:MAG: DUF192 domain-containing protein [Elusimicrobiota bacterium]|jgi:hypothetical protein